MFARMVLLVSTKVLTVARVASQLSICVEPLIFTCAPRTTQIDQDVSIDEFLPLFVDLAFDDVSNVRLTMTKLLMDAPEWLVQHPITERALQRLCGSLEQDPDVQHFAAQLAAHWHVDIVPQQEAVQTPPTAGEDEEPTSRLPDPERR